MTKENREAASRIILDLEKAFKKLPDLEHWKNWFVLRWDKSQWWEWKIWKIKDLKSFTSVANNIDDAFIWKFWNDTQISILWKEWRVKDVSNFAIAVKFWDILESIDKTTNEWIILSNSKVKITDRFELNNNHYIDSEQIQ
jgi:hypothetical protein